MRKIPDGHPMGYILGREMFNRGPAYKPIINYQMESSNSQFYRKNLLAHFGCVNAVEFSNDGSLLASGGDDRRILVWNVHKAIVGKEEPKAMQAEHLSNVFGLAFDCTKTKIFSAGNDDQVIVHDIATGVPLDYFVQEQPVFGVSSDPLNENIFSSACDDGRILIYDIRESTSDPFCLAKLHSSFHSVMFHPIEPRLIVSANAKEGVTLWDVRMPKRPLLKYGRQTGEQYCMSARFNRDGTRILALRRRLPPILYSTYSRSHLFQFNHSSYYNSCTMKSCCFAGDGDQFVVSGSDNFDIHVWKIPPDGSNQWVNQAHTLLKGHRSIANQVRYNYSYNLIASSGVEKMVKLWSPSALSDNTCWKKEESGLTSEIRRKIYSHEEYIRLVLHSGTERFMAITQETGRKTTKEDSRMMAFFDALVQRDIVGLSEDDSDSHSTYTDTVYSTQESSSDDESASVSVIAVATALGISNNTTRNVNQPLSSLESDTPGMIDIDDLPVIQSDSEESYIVQRTSDSEDPVRRLMMVDAELDRVIRVESEYSSRRDRNPDVSHVQAGQASSDPNMLTKLITARELQLKRLANVTSKRITGDQSNSNRKSLKNKCKKLLPRKQTSSPSTSEENKYQSKRKSKKSRRLFQPEDASNSSQDTNLVCQKPPECHLDSGGCRHHRKRIKPTPIYDSSNNSHLTSPDPSYQLINDLMTRTPTSSSDAVIASTSSSSSSSSSSTSSSDNNNLLDDPKFLYLNSSHIKSRMGYGTGVAIHTTYIVSDSSDSSLELTPPARTINKKVTELVRSKRQRRKKNKTVNSDKSSHSSSSEYSSSTSQIQDGLSYKKQRKVKTVETTRTHRSRSRGKKSIAKIKVGTPSDSGIEMSKPNDQEPCCSKSCTPTAPRKNSDKINLLSSDDSSDG